MSIAQGMSRAILILAALLIVQPLLWSVREMVRLMPPQTTRFVGPPVPPPLFIPVTITGYSSTMAQTDSTPFTTAWNTSVRDGMIAMSRDLLRQYTPNAPYAYGDSVIVDGRTYVVEDTMNRRWQRRVDIWFPNKRQALEFGVHEGVLRKESL